MRCHATMLLLVLIIAFAFAVACGGEAGEPSKASGELLLASTTTTQDSGLLDVLVPAFEEATGYSVKVIAGGSGQAIENGRRGDVDALLVHSPDAEKAMVADGDGIERALVMHNDFVLVGPPGDPAGVRATSDVNAPLRAIAATGSRFVSRGDDSGTHVVELKLWRAAGIDPAGERWYEETGQGQGATVQVASQKGAYALVDRGTFLALRDGLDLEIVSEGNPDLLNYYHVIVVNPEKHARVNAAAARAWAAWVTGAEAQGLIAAFGVAEFGESLFVADAGE